MDIAVECPKGMAADTILHIAVVTPEVDVEQIQTQIESDMEVKTVYKIEMLRSGVKVQPDGLLTIKIKLSDAQRRCSDLRVYYVDADNTMTLYDSWVVDGYIIFQSDHLSHWAIVGNVLDPQTNPSGGMMPTNGHIIVIAFALLSISCMALCLIMMAQKRKSLITKSNEKGENDT